MWDNTVDYASSEVFLSMLQFPRKNVYSKIMLVWPGLIVVIHKQLQIILLVIL